jgi:hypothetical protein
MVPLAPEAVADRHGMREPVASAHLRDVKPEW